MSGDFKTTPVLENPHDAGKHDNPCFGCRPSGQLLREAWEATVVCKFTASA
jgi:hypothetical protein